MIAIKCPTHGSRVLLTERHIRRLVNTERGIFVDVECTCGTHVMLRTGRKALVSA
jgi:hypothetical protein